MVKAATHRFHTVSHVQVIAISMHIPYPGVTCVDGDVTATRFAKTPCLKQEFTDGIGLGIVQAGFASFDFVPTGAPIVPAGVIHRQCLGIFT